MNRRRRYKAKARRRARDQRHRNAAWRARMERAGYQTYSADDIKDMMRRLLPEKHGRRTDGA